MGKKKNRKEPEPESDNGDEDMGIGLFPSSLDLLAVASALRAYPLYSDSHASLSRQSPL